MRAKRVFVAATAVVATMLWAAPAGAKAPVGSCPPAFHLMTFDQILTAWPPPPGVDGEAQLAANDHNGDRSLCVTVLAEPVPGPGLLVVDNVVP
jgi:hypothetical protein